MDPCATTCRECGEWLPGAPVLGANNRCRDSARITGEPAVGTSDMEALRAAAGVRSTPAAERLQAARIRGAPAGAYSAWGVTVDRYANVVALVSLLAWHGIGCASREGIPSSTSGLAADPGAVAVSASASGQTVEFLEARGAVLWGPVAYGRTDLGRLQCRAPELADRLVEIQLGDASVGRVILEPADPRAGIAGTTR